jgi:AraC family cel operon transcriptional repressor
MVERNLTLHTHVDYCEVFCVLKGTGRHVTPLGSAEMKRGDLFFIRKEDHHALLPLTADFLMVNVGFSEKIAYEMKKRYYKDKLFFWDNDLEKSYYVKLTDPMTTWFHAETQKLYRSAQTRVSLDAFLLRLFSELETYHESIFYSCPPWLRDTCEKMQEVNNFSKGTYRFAEISGRTSEHVARELKKFTGISPSEFVTRCRMDYAAMHLTLSAKDILEIALDCGFSSLSHFYSVFKKTFGLSPRKYRQENMRSVTTIN